LAPGLAARGADLDLIDRVGRCTTGLAHSCSDARETKKIFAPPNQFNRSDRPSIPSRIPRTSVAASSPAVQGDQKGAALSASRFAARIRLRGVSGLTQ